MQHKSTEEDGHTEMNPVFVSAPADEETEENRQYRVNQETETQMARSIVGNKLIQLRTNGGWGDPPICFQGNRARSLLSLSLSLYLYMSLCLSLPSLSNTLCSFLAVLRRRAMWRWLTVTSLPWRWRMSGEWREKKNGNFQRLSRDSCQLLS